MTFDRAFTQSNFDSATVDEGQDISVAFQRDLDAVFARHSAPGTHFLIPTLDGNHVRAVFRLLQRQIAFADVLHLATRYEPRQMPHRIGLREIDWFLARISRDPAFGDSVFLWAETQVLANLFADRLDARVERLPLPAPRWEIRRPVPGVSDPLVLSFFGDARVDKGILELPEIVAAIAADVRTSGAVRIVLRIVPPHGGYTPAIAHAVASLRAIIGVEIAEGALTPADYRAAMLASHALLIPCRSETYGVRGSGILVEGLASGCVILASADTIAEEFVEEGQVFLCKTPADWADAAAALKADRTAILAEAWRRASIFQKRQAPRTYVDRLAFRVEFERRTGLLTQTS